MPLLEAVPNVSEGRDQELIEQIGTDFCAGGAHLLRIDSHKAAHRSVFTLIGEPQQLIEGARVAAERCVTRIDLRTHDGIHPRMGALDVFPVIALQEEDRGLAQQTATAVGVALSDLQLPVYFYEDSATTPERKWLREVRRRGFEQLEERMVWDAPDLGPSTPHPTAGGVAVGARDILIAFNLSLNTANATIARNIAAQLREFRRVRRDEQGQVLQRETGGLPGVRAIGWYTDDHDCAQISTNLTDFHSTGPHAVLRTAQALAAQANVQINATELIGCLPRKALFIDLNRPEITTEEAAAKALLLGSDFVPAERVLEHQLDRLFPGDL